MRALKKKKKRNNLRIIDKLIYKFFEALDKIGSLIDNLFKKKNKK